MLIEKYCLECGETVPDDAKKCDYCGSDKLDVMDIDEDIV
jgi:RNA polymerase subunit RPABC4/transcription elongation factor Spt4